MMAFAICLLVLSILAFFGGGSVVIYTCWKDKKVEDYRQRQRERANDEMWAMIDAVSEAGRLSQVSEDKSPRDLYWEIMREKWSRKDLSM